MYILHLLRVHYLYINEYLEASPCVTEYLSNVYHHCGCSHIQGPLISEGT